MLLVLPLLGRRCYIIEDTVVAACRHHPQDIGFKCPFTPLEGARVGLRLICYSDDRGAVCAYLVIVWSMWSRDTRPPGVENLHLLSVSLLFRQIFDSSLWFRLCRAGKKWASAKRRWRSLLKNLRLPEPPLLIPRHECPLTLIGNPGIASGVPSVNPEAGMSADSNREAGDNSFRSPLC